MSAEVVPLQRKLKRLVVIGNGMATSRLLDDLILRDAGRRFQISVVGEEPHGAYNRVLLGKLLSGTAPAGILLKDRPWYESHGVKLYAGVRALRLVHSGKSGEAGKVALSNGQSLPYDELVIATGSRAVVPPIEGLREDDELKEGAFVFRTIEDGLALREFARPGMAAVVLGGGVLGLEAARALSDLHLNVTVIDRSSGPMARHLDEEGRATLSTRLAEEGIECVGNSVVRRILGEGQVEGVQLDSGQKIPCHLLVMACGIQPRVELARTAGFPLGHAILVDDGMAVTGVAGVSAVGECAEHRGIVYGIVPPIWEQVRVLADRLMGCPTSGFQGANAYLRLKDAGTEVVSFGAVDASPETDEVVVVTRRRPATYARLVIRGNRLHGAQFVGDALAAPRLVQVWQRRDELPSNRLDLLCSDDVRGADCGEREICNCNHVSEQHITAAIRRGLRTLSALGEETRAGTGCGSCKGDLEGLLLKHAGMVQETERVA